jgi:hypothetical protein
VASEHAFEALHKICRELADGDVVSIFEGLIKGEVHSHVRRNAIIEFTSLCEERIVLEQAEMQDRFAELMLDIIKDLKETDETAKSDRDGIRRARIAAITGLRIFDRAPHVLNSLLPEVMLLVDRDLKNLAVKFIILIEAIQVDDLDISIRESLCQRVEGVWLKKPLRECPGKLKTHIVNTVVKRLRPNRPRRAPVEEFRVPLRNKVELFLPTYQNSIKGQGIDVTHGGFCVEVDATLEGSDFQARNESEPPIRVRNGLEYEMSVAQLRVLDKSGDKYEVKEQKIEIRRAARKQTQGSFDSSTILAGKVIDPSNNWRTFVERLGSSHGGKKRE